MVPWNNEQVASFLVAQERRDARILWRAQPHGSLSLCVCVCLFLSLNNAGVPVDMQLACALHSQCAATSRHSSYLITDTAAPSWNSIPSRASWCLMVSGLVSARDRQASIGENSLPFPEGPKAKRLFILMNCAHLRPTWIIYQRSTIPSSRKRQCLQGQGFCLPSMSLASFSDQLPLT